MTLELPTVPPVPMLVVAAFAQVADRTGYGATLKEIDTALCEAGHKVAAKEITAAMRSGDDTLLIRAARDFDGRMVKRDGWTVWLPDPTAVGVS